jgi:hypothetical protein
MSLSAQDFPGWGAKYFKDKGLDKIYERKAFLKPAFWEADFDGNGLKDLACLIIEKTTKKEGVMIIQRGSNNYFVFGAGGKLGNGSDDFKWAGGWKVYKDKIVYETLFNKEGDMSGSKKIRLQRPALYIYDIEDGQSNSGGLIYWNDRQYIWIHQGE